LIPEKRKEENKPRGASIAGDLVYPKLTKRWMTSWGEEEKARSSLLSTRRGKGSKGGREKRKKSIILPRRQRRRHLKLRGRTLSIPATHFLAGIKQTFQRGGGGGHINLPLSKQKKELGKREGKKEIKPQEKV